MLVTGANGFLGRHLVPALMAHGHSVRAAVRTSAQTALLQWPETVEVVHANVVSDTDLRALSDGVNAVIHLAAALHGSQEHLTHVALDGTRRLLESLKAESTRVVLASSFSVYDWSQVGHMLTEESPLLNEDSVRSHDGYTRAKLLQEGFTRSFCSRHRIPLVVMRPASIWSRNNLDLSILGPGLGPVRLVVGPDRFLRLTHVKNCAAAFVAALDDRALGGTFNVDDAIRVSAREFADRFSGPHRPGWRVPVSTELARRVLDISALATRPIPGKRRIPGLLIRERFQARFHAALAGHESLSTRLGWSPPLDLSSCLAS